MSLFDSKVKAWRQKRTLSKVLGSKVSHERRRWEEDYQLVECEGLFEEYLEMGKSHTVSNKGHNDDNNKEKIKCQ